MSLMISDSRLMATEANLTGSSLRHVNIYKRHSNDANFVFQGTKNVALCWEQSPNFAYCGRGL